MSDAIGDGPDADELEVSLFGPGYGEAVVVHLGAGYWILVDSCIEPQSELPASLGYLLRIGVKVQESVRLVVATHWHDDHIRGFSAITKACQSAEVVMSGVLRLEEYKKLVLSGPRPMRSSGVDELGEVIGLLEDRKQRHARFIPIKLAQADKLLFRDQIALGSQRAEVHVHALSPSEASLLQAQQAIVQMLPEIGQQKKRIGEPTTNHTSVVLWVQVGSHRVLLGADLERTADPQMGWSAILSNSVVINGRASLFKIPHHGSANAHEERVWSELLSPQPFAVLSPFRLGRQTLPTVEDIDRIVGLTPHAYATAPARRRETRWSRGAVRNSVREIARSMQPVHQGWGHVRLRRNITEEDGPWRVELFGDAYPLNSS